MKKAIKNLFLILAMIALTATFSGCGRKNTPITDETPLKNGGNNASSTPNVNNGQAGTSSPEMWTNTDDIIESTDIKNIDCTKINYQGDIIKEEDRWKRYKNYNLGIEFRFQDAEDKIKINEDRNGVRLRNQNDQLDEGNSVYLSIIDPYNGDDGYKNLQEYAEQWAIISSDNNKILSIKELSNLNNIKILEVICDASGMQSGGRHFKVNIYYTEYNRPLRCRDDYYEANLNKGQNYISINGNNSGNNDLMEQLVDSLKFIN